MIRIKVLIFSLCFALLGSPIAAIASDISNALYYGTIIISNNSTANTNVATVANISTANLISGGYLNSTANNTVMRNTSGADVPFMPAYTPVSDFWCMFVPRIGADTYLTYLLYTANSSGGDLYYFPDSGGMTISDNAPLELGVLDFSLNMSNTFVNTDADLNKNLIDKPQSFMTFVSDDTQITAGTFSASQIDITPNTLNAWVDIDISDYLPDNATGVIIQYVSLGNDCGFRMNGSADARQTAMLHGWAMIGVDSNGIFEARLTNAGQFIYLEGYTDESWTFFTNGVDKSLVGLLAWTDIDVSVECPGAVGVVVEVFNTVANRRDVGLRNNASGDARINLLEFNEHFFAVIGCDNAQIFEGYIQDAGTDFYVVGYVTDGSTFKVNADNKSIVPVGAWTNIDCSVEAPNAEWIFMEVVEGVVGNQDYGLRRDGSSDDIYDDLFWHNWGVVGCDESQVIEGQIQNVAVDFFLVGYATSGVYQPLTSKVVADSVASDEYDISINRADEPAMPLWANDVVVGVNMGSGILPVKLLQEQTLSAPAASVTFSGITGNVSLWDSLAGVTSRHLVVMVNASTTNAVNSDAFNLQFNGDSGNNYNAQRIYGTGGATGADRYTNQANMQIGYLNGTGIANTFSGGTILIPHAFNTSNHKSVVSYSGGAEDIVLAHAGRWADISAISSITLLLNANSFDTGSTFLLGVVDERYLVEEAINPAADFLPDFNNIPQDGHDLVVVGYARTDRVDVVDAYIHEINGDNVAANYFRQRIEGAGAVTAAASANDNIIGITTGDNAGANEFGVMLITYSQYAEATNDPHILSLAGYHESTGPNSHIRLFSARWNNVAAITRLEYFPNIGTNFKAGSLFSLYRVPRYVIDRQELTAPQATITFNNIPQNYQALQLNVYARSDDAIPISDEVEITLSGDGAFANFDYQELEGTGAGPPTATRLQNLAGSRVIMLIPAAGEAANEFGGGVVTFPRYSRTDGHKHFLTLSGTNENQVILRSSRWENNAAITRIDLDRVNGANFIAGSIFELVGVMPTKTFNIDIDGEIKGVADGNADVPDSANDLVIGTEATIYIGQYEHMVNAVLRSDIDWEYNSIFTDASGNGNPATPTFRTASADADIIGNMTAFTPISQAQAPPYTLGPTNPFFTTAPNLTGNFSTLPPTGTFPLAGVIAAVANATATPPQLPLLIIACFVILAASLTTSYTLRRFGSGSLIVKAMVIIGVMGVFVALTDWGIDFWMVVIFSILATSLAMMSRQITWR